MTPSQLLVSAHAPCTSTMVGFAPSPAAAALAVPADAIWLSGMTKPAMATITAAIMSRSLPSCVIRAVFTEVSFSGVSSARADARLCATRGSAALTDLRVDGSEGLRLAGSGLCRLGREPQRAGVDSVRVNLQHLPVEFLRRRGFLVEPVEVGDVLAGLIDDARVVVLAVAFVAGYDGTRIQRLDDVERSEPVLAALRV